MGRRNKNAKESFIFKKSRPFDRRNLDFAEEDYVEVGNPKMTRKPSNLLASALPEPPSYPENQNNLAITVSRRLRGKAGSEIFWTSPTGLLENIKRAAQALSRLGDADDVEREFLKFLNSDDFASETDQVDIASVRNDCQTVISSLQQFASSSRLTIQDTLDTNDHFSKHILYRSPTNKVFLLKVAEVFKPNSDYTRRKTFGFVRKLGSSVILQCALSGTKNALKQHPLLLDSQVWLKEVMHFAKANLDHAFVRGPFDTFHNMEDGTINASHIEPSLMLYYTYFLVHKYIRVEGDIQKHLKNAYKLRNLNQDFEAELVLSKAPCKNCTKFQADIEALTGIRFSYAEPMDNVAEILPTKDSIRYDDYARYADAENREDIDDLSEFLIENGFTMDKLKAMTTATEICKQPPPPKRRQRPQASWLNEVCEGLIPHRSASVTAYQQAFGYEPSQLQREPTPLYSKVVTTSTSTSTTTKTSTSTSNVQKDKIQQIQSFSYATPTPSPLSPAIAKPIKKVTKALHEDTDYKPAPSRQLACISTKGSRSIAPVRASESARVPNQAELSKPTKSSVASGPVLDSEFDLEARRWADDLKQKMKKKKSKAGKQLMTPQPSSPAPAKASIRPSRSEYQAPASTNSIKPIQSQAQGQVQKLSEPSAEVSRQESTPSLTEKKNNKRVSESHHQAPPKKKNRWEGYADLLGDCELLD